MQIALRTLYILPDLPTELSEQLHATLRVQVNRCTAPEQLCMLVLWSTAGLLPLEGKPAFRGEKCTSGRSLSASSVREYAPLPWTLCRYLRSASICFFTCMQIVLSCSSGTAHDHRPLVFLASVSLTQLLRECVPCNMDKAASVSSVYLLGCALCEMGCTCWAASAKG